MPEPVRARVEWVASAFLALTGKRIVLSSGVRTVKRTAELFIEKYDSPQGGVEYLHRLYGNDAAITEITDSIEQARVEGASPETVTDRVAKVIHAQIARGVYVSRHLVEGAVDVSYLNLHPAEVRLLKTLAQQVPGALAIDETVPPHLHLQFNPAILFRADRMLSVGLQRPVQEVIGSERYLDLTRRTMELSRLLPGRPFQLTWSVIDRSMSLENRLVYLDGALVVDEFIHDALGVVRLRDLQRFPSNSRQGAELRRRFNERIRGLQDADDRVQALNKNIQNATDNAERASRDKSDAAQRAREADERYRAAEFRADQHYRAALDAAEHRKREHLERERQERETAQREEKVRQEARESEREARDRKEQADRDREKAEREKKEADEKKAQENAERKPKVNMACIAPGAEGEEDILAVYMLLLRELFQEERERQLRLDDGREPLTPELVVEQLRELLGQLDESEFPEVRSFNTHDEYLAAVLEFMRKNTTHSSHGEFRPSCGTPPQMRDIVSRVFERPGFGG
ncbi:hypothetical protein ACJ2CR_19370 [Myxococcus faecalis]|uniref:hypothetical protein n=1 Tax=Myxococcus faecalis TaxID=3115646 RepID=UPI0038D01CB2